MEDSTLGPLIVKPIQPYQASKSYTCPGCAGDIGPGEGHLVVVPELEPELRRHWHRGCWFKEMRRSGIYEGAEHS
jgi:hypothetical protein